MFPLCARVRLCLVCVRVCVCLCVCVCASLADGTPPARYINKYKVYTFLPLVVLS